MVASEGLKQIAFGDSMRLAARIGIMALLATLAGCRQEKTETPEPPGVTVVPAKVAAVSERSIVIAQVKAYDSVDLVARVKGFLRKRNFTEGHPVKQGEQLFLIEQEEYLAQVERAKAALLKALAAQKNATINYERQKKLYEEDAVAQITYDNAVCEKMEKDAAVDDAKAVLALAKINLSYTEINAPFDGVAGLAAYSSGNVVGPESGTLASIVRLEPVRVQFNISETDILRICRHREATGAYPKVVVRLRFQDGSEYEHTGKITFSDNQINPTTGTLLMQATFPNPHHLLTPGMYVRVILESAEKRESLLVPQPALMRDQLGEYVLVAEPGTNKVARRNIVAGQKEALNIVVNTDDARNELKPEELVIVEGIQKVRIGTVVKPVVQKSYMLGTPAASDPAARAAPGIKSDDTAKSGTAESGSENGVAAPKTETQPAHSSASASDNSGKAGVKHDQ